MDVLLVAAIGLIALVVLLVLVLGADERRRNHRAWARGEVCRAQRERDDAIRDIVMIRRAAARRMRRLADQDVVEGSATEIER